MRFVLTLCWALAHQFLSMSSGGGGGDGDKAQGGEQRVVTVPRDMEMAEDPEEWHVPVSGAGNLFFGVQLSIETGDGDGGAACASEGGGDTMSPHPRLENQPGQPSTQSMVSRSGSRYRLRLTESRDDWLVAFDLLALSLVKLVGAVGRIAGHPTLEKCVALLAASVPLLTCVCVWLFMWLCGCSCGCVAV